MKLHFTVSEISKILDISPHTLRYYDKIGLFKSNERGINKYRYYYIEQFDMLITIKMLRAMNIPIDDIKEIYRDNSLERIRNLLSQKRNEIDIERMRLKQTLQKLNFFESEFRGFDNEGTIELITAGPWYAVLTESIIESHDKQISSNIQERLMSLGENRDFLSFCHTLSIVSKDNIENSNYHSYLNNGLISPIKPPTENNEFVYFPACYCARKCITVKENSYGDLDNHYENMKDFINARNLKIIGNSIELNLYNQGNKHYIEIYIPVGYTAT